MRDLFFYTLSQIRRTLKYETRKLMTALKMERRNINCTVEAVRIREGTLAWAFRTHACCQPSFRLHRKFATNVTVQVCIYSVSQNICIASNHK